MKKYLLLGLISFTSLMASTVPVVNPTDSVATMQPQGDKELAWVDEQIQAILPARVGIPDSFINSLRDPMKMKKPLANTIGGSKLLAPPKLGGLGLLTPPKVIEEPLRLQAIINKSVLISGKWYKAGDPIRNYTLLEIKANSALLTDKKDQKLILFLTKQNNNIKIITK
ncbi:MAG: hypothetical protein PHQ90_00760 [Sulfuricurvum sp.]|uniref:hypothetical protein n=1 Tax=Sulfuricurvum sp. TaxID=2025608 RepID=UPI002613C778|nr:hypothetical protein [Sulfuricurvum sp.]MDD2367796.1 hypothetical protein [Sulfuricurvum sp.]MDD2950363.1 hypothetical protein [Sulfuricurvum sp.]MDD5117975.1 hypothetical protein [Sulfuricurvum sp.]